MLIILKTKSQRSFEYILLAAGVQRADNSTQRIYHYPVYIRVCCENTYPSDSDTCGRMCYPSFKQPSPGYYTIRYKN